MDRHGQNRAATSHHRRLFLNHHPYALIALLRNISKQHPRPSARQRRRRPNRHGRNARSARADHAGKALAQGAGARSRPGYEAACAAEPGAGGTGFAGGSVGGGDGDQEALHAQLAELDAQLSAEGQGHGEALVSRDYARERWSRGRQSRLPSQEEWEEMFGKGVSFVFFISFFLFHVWS